MRWVLLLSHLMEVEIESPRVKRLTKVSQQYPWYLRAGPMSYFFLTPSLGPPWAFSLYLASLCLEEVSAGMTWGLGRGDVKVGLSILGRPLVACAAIVGWNALRLLAD